MANERKSMRIYADFNGIESPSEDAAQCLLDLTGYGTLASLSLQQIRLHEGMSLTLFDPDGLEVEAVALFDESKVGKDSHSSGWLAKFKCSLIKECTPVLHDFDKHLCFKCRRDLKSHLLEVGQQYKEICPYCETSVMFPLLPPEEG